MTIGYVLAGDALAADAPLFAEMRALAAQGATVVPLILARSRRVEPAAAAAAADFPTPPRWVDAVPVAAALGAALTPRLSFLRSLAFWFAQCESTPEQGLRRAWRLAAAARDAGCRHLHAPVSGDAAALAILAARWAGLTVSFAHRGGVVGAAAAGLRDQLLAADLAVATHHLMALDFAAMAPGAQVREAPAGVGMEGLAPRPITAPDNGRYLYVGPLGPGGGADDLIEALGYARKLMGRHPDVDVVGDGPQRAALIGAAIRGGGAAHVRFLGARGREWLAREAPAYRALLCPYKQSPEGVCDPDPTPPKLAMAMGLPVIASRFMGLREIVSPEVGLLHPAGDAVGLAIALWTLDRLSPAERRAMGEAGRRRVCARYTPAQHAALLREAVAELRGGDGGAWTRLTPAQGGASLADGRG